MTVYNKYVTREFVTDFGLEPSKDVYTADLAQGETTLTVPYITNFGSSSTKVLVLMKVKTQDKVVVVAVNETASINTGAAFQKTNGEMIYDVLSRVVESGDTLSFYTEEAMGTSVAVAFYALP